MPPLIQIAGVACHNPSVLHAVVFDLDETLLDHESAATSAVTEWAAELGVAADDAVALWSTLADVHYERYARGEVGYSEQRRARVREFLAVPLEDAEADELFRGYLVRYEAAWAAFPDAAPAIERARNAGLAVGVLTNGDEAQQRAKLDRIGLSTLVDVVVASSTLPAGKPDRRAFAAVLGHLRAEPSDALMVGDSLAHDVHGAMAAGLWAVLVDRHGRHYDADVRRVGSLDELDFAGASTGSIAARNYAPRSP